jgi:hypothetical protein
LENLDAKAWETIVTTAVEFATSVCMSYDNYISDDFARRYKL